jgi:hypothetical protein
MATYCKQHRAHVNTLCGRNALMLNIEVRMSSSEIVS